MKIIFTKHVVLEKIPLMKQLGWDVNQSVIKQTIKKPKWHGVTKFGQTTVMDLLDENHILRVVLESEGDIIRVITAHVARRGTYESTKED